MAKNRMDDQYKQKFRPDADAALDSALDAALGNVSMDQLYGFDKPKETAEAPAKGLRWGKVVSIDKDEVFVDLGGKSQGVVPREQFEEEPKVGQQMQFNVERYDAREGLLILGLKGLIAELVLAMEFRQRRSAIATRGPA